MSVEDIFGRVVRLAGLAMVVCAVFDLLHVLAAVTGLPLISHYPATADLTAAVFWLVPGAVLFAAADRITGLAYPRRD